jgi:hypothetical protein
MTPKSRINLLGNGTQTQVPVATNIKKDIPVTSESLGTGPHRYTVERRIYMQ